MKTLAAAVIAVTLFANASLGADAPDRPNILWITCEDTGLYSSTIE